MTLHPKYITNPKGKKISVLLPFNEYKKLMEELEELEDVRLYDEATARKAEYIPAKEAFKRIEEKRRKKK